MEKQTLPNSVASMVLGICSIVICGYGIGLVLGIIGLVLSNGAMKIYNENPEAYTGVGMATAGKVCSIIGIVFGALGIIYLIVCGSALWSAYSMI